MKGIDAIAAEIDEATQSVDSLDKIGRKLARSDSDVAAQARGGMPYEDLGHIYIETKIRIYLAYTLDESMWQRLVDRSEQYHLQYQQRGQRLVSVWEELHNDLVVNIGVMFGWAPGEAHGYAPGEPSFRVGGSTFEQRLRAILYDVDAPTPTQVKQLALMLEGEGSKQQGAAPTSSPGPQSGGCYIATAVYGSYDCPEVWVLRRWRDTRLASTATGRGVIRLYYLTSPTILRALEGREWLMEAIRRPLSRLVDRLRARGYSSLPYTDRE